MRINTAIDVLFGTFENPISVIMLGVLASILAAGIIQFLKIIIKYVKGFFHFLKSDYNINGFWISIFRTKDIECIEFYHLKQYRHKII